MSQTTQASIVDVAHAVCSLPGSQSLPVVQASKIVDSTLRTVIGGTCQAGSTFDVDLGDGLTLSCCIKKSIGPTDV